MAFRPLTFAATSTLAVLALVAGCSDDPSPDPTPPAVGGASTGGVGTGGATGGTVTTGGTTGGTTLTGGAPSGGTTGGTVATGGAGGGGASGGVAGGGTASGGVAGGGAGGKGGSGGATGGAGGTSGGGSGGSTTPASFETMKLILTSLCQGCHGSDMSLNLNTDPGLYGRLTAPTAIAKSCGSIPVITKGDPSKSAMYKMLEGTCPPPFTVMPDGCNPADGNCVEANYVDAVKRWIAAGAPEN